MKTLTPTTTVRPAGLGRAVQTPDFTPGAGLTAAVFVLAILATLTGVWGGPDLGDHEAIVAQTARNMRLSGDWIVPTFMDQPWFRKPPLPYWLVAGVSYLFPPHAATGLPVTPESARLPSALAGLGTILLLWKLGSTMFGRRAGLVTATIASSTIMFLLYSPNATAEMPLTFCCVWAYLHFWYAVTARASGRRLLHLTLYYVALGMAMLAKGPAPVAMVGLPLAVWWYTHRPLRILARWLHSLAGRTTSDPHPAPTNGDRYPHPAGSGGLAQTARRVLASFIRGLWPRTREAFTRLWLLPGLVLFGLFFVPWMLIVAERVPHAWDTWGWQYLERAQGDYLDSKDRPVWYYLSYVVGFVAPWIFLIFEAAAAPWLKRYARFHRALLYAGLWALVAIGVMSLEPFKKPYYILPALPGLILMMAAVADRFYSLTFEPRRWMWLAWGAAAVGLTGGAVGGAIALRHNFPADVATRLTLIVSIAAALLLVAGALHIRRRAWMAFGLLAVTTVTAFQTAWHTAGEELDNVDRARDLAQALAELPADARILWADGRPDSRLEFYFDRHTGYMIPPSEIVGDIPDRKQNKLQLQLRAVGRAKALLEAPQPIYLIWERGNYEEARARVGLGGRIVASVSRGDRSRKDWVVVTNHP